MPTARPNANSGPNVTLGPLVVELSRFVKSRARCEPCPIRLGAPSIRVFHPLPALQYELNVVASVGCSMIAPHGLLCAVLYSAPVTTNGSHNEFRIIR